MKDQEQIVAWIGVDWADEGHHVWEYNVGTGGKENYAVQHSAESLQEWLSQVRSRYAGKRVAVVMEQARGGLIYSLMNTDFVVIFRSIHSHWRNTARPFIPAEQKAIPRMRNCWAKWSGKIPSAFERGCRVTFKREPSSY